RDGAGDAVVEAFGTRLRTPVPDEVSAGDEVTLTFRPETVRWHETDADRPNVVPVRIVRVEFLGEIVEYEAEVLAEGESVGTIVGRGAPLAIPPEGGRVFLELVPHACRVLAA
ncbi:MAG: TOBE domain-containing protein, partial [Rhodoglobus sp.]|nr:TOBE domain-containing protein [Rhodoglobus sp.]